jgi:hypothetical protein
MVSLAVALQAGVVLGRERADVGRAGADVVDAEAAVGLVALVACTATQDT